MNLGEALFLQNKDGSPAKVKADGSPGGEYYVYFGYNTTEDTGAEKTAMRVYHNQDSNLTHDPGENGAVSGNDIIAETDETTGRTAFKAKNVWLFTEEQYTNFVSSFKEESSQNKDGSPNGDFTEKLSNFELLTLDPSAETAIASSSSEVAIESKYMTNSEFWTETLHFGRHFEEGKQGTNLTLEQLYDQTIPDGWNKGPEDIAKNTAEAMLKSGFGLLFSAITSGMNYRFTEKLSAEDIDDGYTLESLRHRLGAKSEITYRLNGTNVESTPEGQESTANFDNKKHAYSVYSDTGAYEEAGHYANVFSDEKTETQINGGDVTPPDPENNPNAYPSVKVGDDITYEIKWHNAETNDKDQAIPAKVIISDPLDKGVDFVSAWVDFEPISSTGLELEAGRGGSVTTGDQVPKITYDAGSHTVIWDLGEQNARARGLVYLKVRVNGKSLNAGEVENDAPVKVGNNEQWTNKVKNPVRDDGDLTVSKVVTGGAADRGTEFHFTVELSDKSINGAYGDMTFTDGAAEFTLKDGDHKTAAAGVMFVRGRRRTGRH